MRSNYDIDTKQLVIPAGSTVSAVVHIGNVIVTRIRPPSTWATAGITPYVGVHANSLGPLYDSSAGAVEELKVAAGHESYLAAEIGQAMGPWLQIASGTPTTPVAQTIAAVVTITFRPY